MSRCIDLSSSRKKTAFFAKDCAKFQHATKLISRGSANSSSHSYAVAAGDLCNVGAYETADVVAVSAEGRRRDRVAPDREEIERAVAAGVAEFVTDDARVRATPYNVGEREVAQYLAAAGYADGGSGRWRRASWGRHPAD